MLNVDFRQRVGQVQATAETKYIFAIEILCRINDIQSSIGTPDYNVVLEIDREIRECETSCLPRSSAVQRQIPPELVVRPNEAIDMRRYLQRLNLNFNCVGPRRLPELTIECWSLDSTSNLVRSSDTGGGGRTASKPAQVSRSPCHAHIQRQLCWMSRGVQEDYLSRQKFAPSSPILIVQAVDILCGSRRGSSLPQFHTFSACACLAASVIRAPRSVLAQSSLASLEDGVQLYQESGRLAECVRHTADRADLRTCCRPS